MQGYRRLWIRLKRLVWLFRLQFSAKYGSRPGAGKGYNVIRIFSLFIALTLSVFAVSAEAPDDARAAWEAQVGAAQKDNPAYAYVADDPALPRVLIIGDSISVGYTAAVRALLQGKANVHRLPGNGGSTQRGLERIEEWLGSGTWDVIHFNWGLHDIKRLNGKELDSAKEKAISPETYEANLRALTQRLQKTGAKLIWAATTPVPEGAKGRIPGDEIEYNRIAAKVMGELKVPINDLHGYVRPQLKTLQKPADVHYLPEGYAFLATRVAEQIGTALGTGK